MPSLEDNRNYWTNYTWSKAGDEWSVGYGGTEFMWAWTIMPRVANFLPAASILEIAPGYGRVTQYLAPACRKLIVLDLAERCIEACRQRFAGYDHIDYHVNDGRSLEMIDDDSVDFVFSWDSLIHVEEDVMKAYLMQLGRKLRSGGAGLFHHSNLDAYRDKDTGQLTVDNEHWRAPSMSAAKFARFCRAAGLRCLVQELVPWGGPNFTDCISLFRRVSTPLALLRRPKVIKNDRFFVQVQQRLAEEVRDVARWYR
jgi:SAM-dependent methyltransferase